MTYKMVWEHMAHQTWQIQGCECPRLTKRYVYNGLGDTGLTKCYKYNCLIARGSLNVTYTMVWGRMTHQTLQIHWLDCPWLTKRYIYNGVGAHCSPNLTNTWVLISMAHPTLHIQRFATHGSPNLTNTIVLQVFIVFKMFQVFQAFPVVRVLHLSVFSMFSRFSMLSINGVFWICGKCALNGVPWSEVYAVRGSWIEY